jgi:hypothetical protein
MLLVEQFAKNELKGFALYQGSLEFLKQFDMFRDILFLEKHVRKLKEAESFLSSVHKERAGILDILGTGLFSLFQYKGNTADLKCSIALLRESMTLLILIMEHPL